MKLLISINNKTITVLIVVLSLAIVILALLYPFLKPKKDKVLITNYEECLKDGNLSLLTYPKQCLTRDGTVFLNQVAQDIQTTSKEINFENIAKDNNTFTNLDAQNLVINDQTELKKILTKIGASSKFPDTSSFDFSMNTLIAVFQGKEPSGGYSIEITKIIEVDKIIVTVMEKSPGLGCVTTTETTNPYHIIKIPISIKPILFQTERKTVQCLG